MKSKIKLLSVSACLLSAVGVQAKVQFVPNRVLVKTKSSLKSALSQMNSASMEAGVVNPLLKLTSNVSVLRFSTGVSAEVAAQELSQLPEIEWAQPDYIYGLPESTENSEASSFSLPSVLDFGPFAGKGLNDPMLTIDNVWGVFKISAPEAWNISVGSEKVIVADIDTGVDYRHEDLKDNMWTNPDSSAADKYGYDFANKDADPMDDHMHGTHTTGTIGARGNNGKGIAGVSPNLKIMAIKFISKEGSGTTSDAILSIDYAVAKGARILSNSWGGPAEGNDSDKALEEAITRAGEKDVLFVAAAGNDGQDNDATPTFPAAYPVANILTVASSTLSDGLSFFSNYGKKSVHVAAPGSNILSTVPGNKYSRSSGTSMACPHVAGLAALMLSVNPRLSALDLKRIIMETVDQIPTMGAKIASGGRVNAQKAIKRAVESGI